MVTNEGNLEPGTAVPRTGTYVCGWCGPGGLAQATAGPLNSLKSGGTTLRNADFTTPASTRLTVYTFASGARLPQCPTCGPATGWDLLTGTLEELLRQRVERREAIFGTLGIARSEPADPRETELDRLTIATDETRDGAPCDACGRRLAPGAGYLLATPQVLTSERYWCHVIRISAANLDGLADRAAQEALFSRLLRARERDRTPWLICDDCTEMFLVDWPVAREHVLRGTRPPGPGRLRNRFGVADYVLPAARAWTRERGWWPATVVAPQEASGDCDLCGKPMWANETVSFLDPGVVAEWTRAGVLTTDSADPPRVSHGKPGWLACGPCLSAALARLHRQKTA